MRPEFVTRPYDAAEDYEWMASAWAKHGDTCLPIDVLPPTGIVAMVDGVRWACGLFWLTNGKTIVIAPSVADARLPPRLRAMALAACLEAVVASAREACPDGMIWAAAHDPAVRNVFVNRFDFCDTGLLHTAASAGSGFSLDIISSGGT